MVVGVDLSDHWQYVTGVEPVLFFPKTDDEVYFPEQGVNIDVAKLGPPDAKSIGGNADLSMIECSWTLWLYHLQAANLGPPKRGDKLQQRKTGAFFLILHVPYLSLQTRFRCGCVREVT